VFSPQVKLTNSGPEVKETKSYTNVDNYMPILEALRNFCGELSAESLTYLTGVKRGLTLETIKQFKIFDIKDYKKTKDFLMEHFSMDELKQAGIINSKNRFVFTKNKIVIPVNENSRIVSLRARFFDNGQDNPEQLQSKTYTYPKYESLKGITGRFFNADMLLIMRPGERLYLCEGEFDTMIAGQNGLKAIGLLGVSNYNPEMIKRLRDYDLFILLDNDEPGRKQRYKIADIFRAVADKEAKITNLPEGIKDLTEYFIKHPGQATWNPRTTD